MNAGAGEQLQRIEIASEHEFQGAKLTVASTPAGGGDGFVNVGFISADGVDLARVTIDGDLGRVVAGDSVVKTTGLGVLKTCSLGTAGVGTQEALGTLVTNISGRLGELSVTLDITGAQVNVTGGQAGTIGKITVGQDILGQCDARFRRDRGQRQHRPGEDRPRSEGRHRRRLRGRAHRKRRSHRLDQCRQGHRGRGRGQHRRHPCAAKHRRDLRPDLGGTFINSGAIRAAHQLKSLTVGGDIVGNPSHFVAISGRGQLTPSATTDVAIGSAKVTGNVSFANILAGYDQLGVALNPDAQIGTVKVGGNWTSGNVVAGVASGGDTFFGNAGDLSIVSTNDTAIISKIASITIGGTVNGTAVGGDFFGFVAEHVVAVKINGAAIVLTSGPGNNLVPVSTGSATGDFFILEVV